ncbi:uncharacterized protein METZ01_LOCUS61608, partial [marine metagenome]
RVPQRYSRQRSDHHCWYRDRELRPRVVQQCDGGRKRRL